MERTSEQSNSIQYGNEPGENAQVVRLQCKPTRQNVANSSGADYIVVARSALERAEVMIRRAKGVIRLVLFYLTTLKQMF